MPTVAPAQLGHYEHVYWHGQCVETSGRFSTSSYSFRRAESEVGVDESRLRQLLQNLLNNASRFTPEGGAIALRDRAEDGHLIVEVQDTGPGIAKEVQKRLFESYYQGELTDKGTKDWGLGWPYARSW